MVLVVLVSVVPISAIVVLVMLMMLIVLKVLSMVSVVSKGHPMSNGGGMHKSTTMMTAVVRLASKETSNKGSSADSQSSGRKSAHWHAVAGRGRWVVSSIGGCWWVSAIRRMSSGVSGCCWRRVCSIGAGWVGGVRRRCAIGGSSIRSTVWWRCAVRRGGSAIGRRSSTIGGRSSAIGSRSGSIGTGGWGSMSIGVMGCSARHTGHAGHTGDMRHMGEALVGCCRGS